MPQWSVCTAHLMRPRFFEMDAEKEQALATMRARTQALHPQTHLGYSKANLSILSLLSAHGFLSSVSLGSSQAPHDPLAFITAPAPAKILVANLKYRGDRSVIGTLDLVSKPSRPIKVDHEELGRLLRGRRVKGVRGVGMGEMLLVRQMRDTPRRRHSADGAADTGRAAVQEEVWLEGRDAHRRGEGGEVMVRVGPE